MRINFQIPGINVSLKINSHYLKIVHIDLLLMDWNLKQYWIRNFFTYGWSNHNNIIWNEFLDDRLVYNLSQLFFTFCLNVWASIQFSITLYVIYNIIFSTLPMFSQTFKSGIEAQYNLCTIVSDDLTVVLLSRTSGHCSEDSRLKQELWIHINFELSILFNTILYHMIISYVIIIFMLVI